MADFTKKAIRASFVKLLNEKPLKQITVRDIVDDCGVNRNTFYYHFHDIPDLIETTIKQDAKRMIDANPTIDSIDHCIDAVIGFALENRKAVLHIYRSVNRDIYEQYQWELCSYAISTYLHTALKDKHISQDDEELLIGYGTCVAFGLVIGWLKDGMHSDIRAQIRRLCVLKQGELERMIERCEQEPI